MPILRDRVLQNKQERTTNDLQSDGRETRRVLRLHRPLAGKRKSLTVPASSSAVLIHGLGYTPRGYTIELGDNNGITCTARDKTEMTFANSVAAEAALTLWIY